MATNLAAYITTFQNKLNTLQLPSLSFKGYPKDYLETLLKNSTYYLHVYVDVLEKLLDNSGKGKEEISLVDYGSGNGLLGLFAKHCGFKKVYLNDMSKIFIEAAKELSEALNINIDGFIEGDCDELLNYFEEFEKPNAVVGTDVIEHIYSLENFFCCVRSLNEKTITVFTTASVTANVFKSRQLMKLQHHDEYKGSNEAHAMPGDEFAGLPFREIRKKIIKQNFPELGVDVLDKLAMATRGMNKKDIIETLNSYRSNKLLPQPANHPTNTCDPVTGSWTERLLTEEEYERVYRQYGFNLKIYNGFYNQWQSGFKALPLKLFNNAIALLGKKGNSISPFITLVGTAKS